ncbi:MAG TPA: folylpolyglutamate synthase/dihydrofolate synthase family protein [Candidatus Cloacimonas sp.]|nr:folylpolyglutamate synthase/dihydrofolate synthase family protein [Candidatus Cloacimonas sp.]
MLYNDFLEHIFKRYSGNVKLELNRMQGLLYDMGNPEQKLNGFHIAGTNGKGSVCATLEALCMYSGLKTALNTSPHLINYNERFRINGKEPSLQTILNLYQRYETLFDKWEASFFEITTALAFALFSEQHLDVSIIEVGLGGRLDATNLFFPEVAVITNIGLDHTKTLGGTLELIAGEKAGIIKEGIPLVLGEIEASPRTIIEAVAMAKQVPVFRYQRDWQTSINNDSIDGINLNYQFGNYALPNLEVNLIGEHQAINIGTALTAFILYVQKKKLPLNEGTIRQALKNISWQGRMQVLSRKPIIILDGAHNVHGVKALMQTLEKLFPNRKVKFLLSILRDKDYPAMLSLICSRAEQVYVAQNQSERAATVDEQVSVIANYEIPCKTAPSVAEAYALAVQECNPDDVLIVCGSLYTVGEVLSTQKDNA